MDFEEFVFGRFERLDDVARRGDHAVLAEHREDATPFAAVEWMEFLETEKADVVR